MEKLAGREDNDPTRSCVFKAGINELIDETGEKKRGRPRASWKNDVFKHWCGNF